jgi:hypothetical protein
LTGQRLCLMIGYSLRTAWLRIDRRWEIEFPVGCTSQASSAHGQYPGNEESVDEMVEYMEMGVKPLIEAVPQAGRILEQYGIGCAECAIGTCKVGEVVKFHGLSPQCEAQMWSQIEQAVRSAGEALCSGFEEVRDV